MPSTKRTKVVTSKKIPTELELEMERGDKAIPCECGGYCDKVDCTDEERKEFNCGRSYDCCSVAFVCRICKTRYAGTQPAPEME